MTALRGSCLCDGVRFQIGGPLMLDCRAVPATFGNEMLDECALALRDPPLLTLFPGPSIRRRSMTPRCLFDLRGSWQIRESNSRCFPSGKVPDTHSVDSSCDHDFGVFIVTNIATENTDAVLPAHPLPRTPKAANQGLQRCRGPSVPLTRLAPLAAWQSLCTGHVDTSPENSVALAFTDGDPSPAADTSVSLASARLRSATPRPTRKQAEAFGPRTGLRDALRERALVGLPERESTAFRSGVNRPPLDPSYHRLRRRRSLALSQARDPRPVQRRSVHKDILAGPDLKR
jgi:hypothetical protein